MCCGLVCVEGSFTVTNFMVIHVSGDLCINL